MPTACLEVDSFGVLKDGNNRTVTLRGINLDGGSKLPVQQTSFFDPVDESYWDGDNVSFVNRPFLLEDAPKHFAKLKSYGFNTIRYVFTWEALEHKGPGIYDDEYIDFAIKVLKLLDEFDFYVFMDPHQDNVSISQYCNFIELIGYSGLDTAEGAEPPYGHTMPWVWSLRLLRLQRHALYRVTMRIQRNIRKCFGLPITAGSLAK